MHIPIKMVESLQHSDTENTSSIQRRNISGAQPRPCDVILGRGKRYQNNPGNILFQGTIGRINISIVKFVLFTHTKHFLHNADLVKFHRFRYLGASFKVKRTVIESILRVIRSTNGRFVQVNGDDCNGWLIVPDKKCRLKIAHAIQHHIRKELSPITLTEEETASAAGSNITMGAESVTLVREDIVRAIRQKMSELEMYRSRELTNCDRLQSNNRQAFNGVTASTPYGQLPVVGIVPQPPATFHVEHERPVYYHSPTGPNESTRDNDQFVKRRLQTLFKLRGAR